MILTAEKGSRITLIDVPDGIENGSVVNKTSDYMLIDTHVHLNAHQYDEDLKKLSCARDSGMRKWWSWLCRPSIERTMNSRRIR